MTTLTKPRPSIAFEPRRFSVVEYYAMAEAGILTEDDRVELLDGAIITMSPIGSGHAATVGRFTRMLVGRVGERAIVQVQNPVRLDNGTELQPDLMLLRERADFYQSGHPGPADVLLLIEVADSSVNYDRQVKLSVYAQAGIPEVWLAVLPERVVEAHTEPTGDGYAVTRRLRAGAIIAPGCFPDLQLPVSQILPG